MKYLAWITFVLALDIVLTQMFTNNELKFVELVQRSFCGGDNLCTSPNNVLADPNSTNTRTINDLPVEVPPYIDLDCCQPCSCNTTTCTDYGNCCPDTFDVLPTLEQSLLPRPAACQMVSLKGEVMSDGFWVYRLCDKNYIVGDNITAAVTQSKCEDRESYTDLDVWQPVVDNVTQRTYANKHCAICNFANELDLIKWQTRVACYFGAEFTQRTSVKTLVDDIFDTEGCDLEFHWPNNMPFLSPSCINVITECNVTGWWLEYDPLIEAACHAYRSVYNFKYNNIFCFLCNEVENVYECIDDGAAAIGTVSFAAILDFDRAAAPIDDVTSQCSATQVYDHYKDICRDLSCTFPRFLENGQCASVGDSVIEVAYRFQLKFQPLGIYEPDRLDDLTIMMRDYIDSLLTLWFAWDAVADYDIFYKLTLITLDQENSESNTMQSDTTESTNTGGGTTEQQPMFPEPKRRKRQDNGTSANVEGLMPPDTQTEAPEIARLPPDNVDVPGDSSNTNIFDAILGVEYLLWQVKWYFKFIVSRPHSADFLDIVLDVNDRNVTLTDALTGENVSFHLSITDFPQGENFYPLDPTDYTSLAVYPLPISLPKAEFLNPVEPHIQIIKPALVCPLITINDTEFNITENLGGIYLFELNQTFVNSHIEVVSNSPDNVRVYSICKDVYLAVTDRYAPNITTIPPEIDGVTPQGVLSVVCACISILCSLLTLLTYVLFSELRTQPGINNMLLCISAICAQALFTFATPQYDSVSETACAFLGALVHFFWLMVVFSMNVCCYHMVMVFIGQSVNRDKNGSRLIKTTLYIIYCVLASILFVSINIIVVVVDSDNTENGYGNGICYISRQNMVGYTFALPLGLVILVNIIYFVIVIVKISRSPTIASSNKKDRNYFKIYAKLSTLTGFTWIFGFLFEFTDQAVFEYLFIILNGGIGVLIFISFVCNKRIYNLFKGKITTTLSKSESTSAKSTKTREISL